MKKFLLLLCTVIVVLGMTVKSNALEIPSGYSAIWTLGFSYEPPPPSGYDEVGASVSNVSINSASGFYYVELYDNYPSAGESPAVDSSWDSDQLQITLSSTTDSALLDDYTFYLMVFNDMDDSIELDTEAHCWVTHTGGTTGGRFDTVELVAPVPEPATMLLLGSGLIFLAAFRRRFRKS